MAGAGSHVRALPLIPIFLALLGIAISISVSPWFNITENALSDLGHAANSATAPIFNGSLVLAGVLAFAIGFSSGHVKRRYNIALMFSAAMLALVGAFDEIYGALHFAVSVMFFVGIMAFVLLTALDTEVRSTYRAAAAALFALNVIMWISHLYYRTPRGAAVPELASVFSFLPFYLMRYYPRRASAR